MPQGAAMNAIQSLPFMPASHQRWPDIIGNGHVY
jgi:hypothetical protein